MTLSRPPALVLSALLTVACASSNDTYGGLDPSSQLFLQDDENDEEAGYGLMLLSDADITCSDFEDAIEDDATGDDDELLDLLEGTNGLLVVMGYAANEDAVDSLSEGWTGIFTSSGAIEGQDDDQIGRIAATVWFEEGGTWTEDSTGLVLTVSEYDNGAITGDIWHPWDSLDFTTEDCGEEEFIS